MKSTTLLFSGSAAALLASLFVYGCSSDDASRGNDDDDDAGSSSSSSSGAANSSSGGGGGSSSGGSSSGAVEPAACYEAANAVGWSATTQTAGSGECTEAQIDALWIACGGAAATEAACDAAKVAQASCYACASGDAEAATRKTGLFRFELDDDGKIEIAPFSFVCEANAIGQAAECGTKSDNLDSCFAGGCAACVKGEDEEADAVAFEACAEEAAEGACKQFVTTTDCEALFETPANVTLIEEKCGDLSGDDVLTEADFKKATAYICGTPPS